jgi:hypothetical protein
MHLLTTRTGLASQTLMGEAKECEMSRRFEYTFSSGPKKECFPVVCKRFDREPFPAPDARQKNGLRTKRDNRDEA